MKILVVDDEVVSRNKMHDIMTSIGDCEIAVNGLDALNLFLEAFDTGNSFDLIFLDIDMPVMNGIELLSKIRKKEKESNISETNQVKVIMVTASTEHDVVVKSLKAGCDNYLVKPFDTERVLKKIENTGLII